MSSSDRTATRAGGRHGKPWRAAGAAVVVLLAVVGAVMIGASFRTVPPPRPPQPLAQAATAGPTTTPTTSPAIPGPANGANPATAGPLTADQPSADDPAPNPDLAPAALSRSTPTSVTIPTIGVHAEIMSLGLNPDGSIEVPPLAQAMKAGWYSLGASPGEAGNAVIVGHVDSSKLGPAVFFNLGALKPGDTISVAREDGSTATFTVNEVKSYPKTDFPTELVYGPSDTPSLRVVTCGGAFDQSAGSYVDNVIAFATMTP
ncbi:class F sortase [Micromonospora sp. NPDC006766]|uniref:class F sortase n=1 Tax=Micromonospora sp. NPDC006766 TaxID=3154778 RepID=UPI0033F49459